MTSIMLRVRFSGQALADVQGIAAHIAADSKRAANRVIGRLEEACFKLGALPGLGRPSEVPGVRKLVVPPWGYKILYQVGAAAGLVVILRVYHPSRSQLS